MDDRPDDGRPAPDRLRGRDLITALRRPSRARVRSGRLGAITPLAALVSAILCLVGLIGSLDVLAWIGGAGIVATELTNVAFVEGWPSKRKAAQRLLLTAPDLPHVGWRARRPEVWLIGFGRDRSEAIRRARTRRLLAVRQRWVQQDQTGTRRRWLMMQISRYASAEDAALRVPERFAETDARYSAGEVHAIEVDPVGGATLTMRAEHDLATPRGDGICLHLGCSVGAYVTLLVAQGPADEWSWDELTDVAARLNAKIGARGTLDTAWSTRISERRSDVVALAVAALPLLGAWAITR